MEFPAFRSAEWVNTQFKGSEENFAPAPSSSEPASESSSTRSSATTKLATPPEVLKGIDLSPSYMNSFETVGLYPQKVEAVKQSIRTALFRQSLLKVQNVEVMHMSHCTKNRILKNIKPRKTWMKWPIQSATGASFLHEELWTVDRCGIDAKYIVRYYKEGANGFSSRVIPRSLKDMYYAVKYYLS